MAELEIDPPKLSDKALRELIHQLGDSENYQELVTRLKREQIRRAIENCGLSKEQIIRTLCRAETLQQRKAIAKEWAAILGLSESDFLGIAGFRKTSS